MTEHSTLNNPMRFAIGNRRIDIEKYDVDVTELEIRPGDGSIYVHWDDSDDSDECDTTEEGP